MLLNPKILSLPIIFLFLPAFVIFLSEKSYFPITTIVFSIVFFFILLTGKTFFLQKILRLANKDTPLKYLLCLHLWIILTGLNAIFFGYYTFGRFLIIAIILFIFRVWFVYLYPVLVIPSFVNIKLIIKIFYTAYIVLCILGILEFFSVVYNIDIINNIISTFSNIRAKDLSIIIEMRSRIPRIRSLFMEPGVFARFLTINLPLIYGLSMSKYKIYNHKILNSISKKVLVLLTWICLFLTQSPIFLVFALLVTFIYFYKRITYFLYKHIILAILTIVFIVTICFTVDISNTYLARIINVIQIIPSLDIEQLINVEGSLATRIVCYINQFQIFLSHPFSGIGFGNTGFIVIKQFMHSKVPLTLEMQSIVAQSSNNMPFTSNAMYQLLYQTGIIGFCLYCIYIIKTINLLKKNNNFFQGIERDFAVNLFKTLIITFSLSIIYSQGFVDEYMLFLCGLSLAMVISVRRM